MKLARKIIFVVIIAVAALYLGLNIFVATKGKEILSSSLTPIIGKGVSAKSLSIIPLYSVSISGFEIEDFLTINKIKVEPSILGLFFGKIGLNKIVVIKPEVSIVRINDKELNISPIIDSIIKLQANQNNQKVNLFIKDIVVREGRVLLEDKTVGVSLAVSNGNIYIHTNPLSLKTTLNLDADIVSIKNDSLGKVSLSGWLNLLKKDMDARFVIEDLEAAHFYPYFNKFLSPIESGNLSFSADMVSKNNDLAVDCHLAAHNLKFATQSLAIDINGKKIVLGSNVSGLLLDSVIGPGGGGVFDFSIHTKFDSPKLEGLQFKGNIFKNSLENIIKKLPEENVDTLKSIGKDFKEIGKEFKEQFKDIKDVFKGFKKQVTEGGNAETTEQQSNPQ